MHCFEEHLPHVLTSEEQIHAPCTGGRADEDNPDASTASCMASACSHSPELMHGNAPGNAKFHLPSQVAVCSQVASRPATRMKRAQSLDDEAAASAAVAAVTRQALPHQKPCFACAFS